MVSNSSPRLTRVKNKITAALGCRLAQGSRPGSPKEAPLLPRRLRQPLQKRDGKAKNHAGVLDLQVGGE